MAALIPPWAEIELANRAFGQGVQVPMDGHDGDGQPFGQQAERRIDPGGGFQLFGQNLADVINAEDAALMVEAIATRGSRQNLTLLERAEIDIGLVEGNAARQALDGVGRPAADLRVLAVMYPNPGMFVVRASSDYRTIDDLKGRPIAFGTRASGLRILVNDVLSGLGLSPERDFQQIILEKAADGSGGFLLTCSRGYGDSMIHAILEAGSALGLRPAGENRFSAWIQGLQG